MWYAFTSALSAEGATPEGELLLDGSGNLWGTTTGGGTSSNGVLFKFAPSTLTYTAMVKFTGIDIGSFPGRQPSGPLVMDAAGAIWGTTTTTVFKYAPSTTTFTNIFSQVDTSYPTKSVHVGSISKTAAGNIRFLGTEGSKELSSPNQNFVSPRAVIYQVNPTTNAVTKVHSLMEGIVGPQTLPDFSPAGGLYEHTDGRFYGLIKSGGLDEDGSPAGGGMIYRVSTGPAAMTQPYNSPSVTAFYTLVSNNTATLRGFAYANGNAITTEFQWGPTSDLGNTASAALSSGSSSAGIYSASLSGLTPASTYFYRFVARTATGEPSYGPKLAIQTGAAASFPTNAEISVESPISQVLIDNVGTVDLGSLLVGQSAKQSFVVRNQSAANSLMGLGAGVSGANAGDFVITRALTSASLAGQASDALLITFTPSGSGARTATLTITSDDLDESSFEVQLTGEGLIKPEIQVETPSAITLDDGRGSYDFGTGGTGVGMVRTFTIRNIGNAALGALSGLNVTVSGDNSADFECTTQPPTSIAAAGTGTFVITMTPSFGGLRRAQIQIANDDSDEAPFVIDLRGTGIAAPEITVTENGLGLTDGASTLTYANTATGVTRNKTITITNSGSATLSGISLSVVGTNSGDFIPGSVVTSIPAGGQATFTLSFIPLAATVRNATLRIASNDSDENPFDIALSGTGITGSVDVLGLTKTRLFDQTGASQVTAKNFSMQAFIAGTGLSSSFPSSSNRFTRTGGTPTALSFDTSGGDWLYESFFGSLSTLNTFFPNGAYSFLVGSDSVTISLPSDSYPNTPVITSSAGIWLGGRLQVSPAQAAAGFSLSSNVSSGDGFLTLEVFSATTDVLYESITDNQNLDQSLSAAVPAGSLQAGTIYTVEAEFDEVVSSPLLGSVSWAASGAQGFGLYSTRTVFEIEVVTPAPEISVEVVSGTPLVDGAASIDMGTAKPGQASAAKVITIQNLGAQNLTLGAISVDGTNAADFIPNTTGLTSTLTPGASTTFQITFNPEAVGNRTAALHIANNDGNENPFDINLTGTGDNTPQPPLFTVQPQSQLVMLGGTANFMPTVTGDTPMTFKWKKGTAFILNANAASYSISSVKTTDIGAFSLEADNHVGAPVLSQPAYLGVVTPTTGTQILKKGATLTLAAKVAAPAAVGVTTRYQWQREGVPLVNTTTPVLNQPVISGADKATLSITKLDTANSGTYTCLITLDTPSNDPTAFIGDTEVTVVDALPVVNAIPPMTVSVSQSIDLTVSATNSPTSFSLVGLPNGMNFDTKTGRLTGKPKIASLKDKLTGLYIPNKLLFKAANPMGTSLVAMELQMTIEALDPGYVGSFYGVVERESFSNFNMGGHVKIMVASTGIVSGSATLAGQLHSVVGALDISVGNGPTAILTVKRTPATLGDLRLEVTSIVAGQGLMQGKITDERFELVSGQQDLGDKANPDHVDGSEAVARFNSPHGIVVQADGFGGFVADTNNHVIRLINSDNEVSTFVGTAEIAGQADGTGTAASFEAPEGLALDATGTLYVADTGNATIRKVSPLGAVTTFAGAADQTGNINATGNAARFNQPSALCFDPSWNLYVVDRGSHVVRKITPAGVVTTLAGKAEFPGHKDGTGVAAQFNNPGGIVYEPVSKALYLADTGNFVIRKITLAGAVTTYAGSPGVQGVNDGLLANVRFSHPTGITAVGSGMLVVGDQLLVQLNPNGTAGTLSEFLDSPDHDDNPIALDFDEVNGVVVAAHDTLHGISTHEADSGTVSADFAAKRNPWTSLVPVPLAQQGTYNAAIETTAEPTDTTLPQGDGYAQVIISSSGVANWTGKAADGSSITFSTFMAADRSIPLHAMLYTNTGSLQGETFINTTTLDLVNDNTPAFDWFKISRPLVSTDRSYKSGFILHPLKLFGGKYIPNNIYSYLGLTGTPASMNMNFTAPSFTPLTIGFTVATPNTVKVLSNSNSALLSIAPSSGIYTGSFKIGTPAVTANFAGIIVNYTAGSAKRGYGHFLLPASTSTTAPLTSGRVRLER